MSAVPPPEPQDNTPTLPYATPQSTAGEVQKTLGAVAALFAFVAIAILLINGSSWPAVAAIGILAVVVIAYGYFITRLKT